MEKLATPTYFNLKNMLEYNCLHCVEELKGDFGDPVYCKKCNKTFETDWDYIDEGNISSWLTGVEHEGKID